MGTQVIGVLEVMWKVVESIIDTQIKTVATVHNVLHVLCASRGTGASIMELNMM